MLPVRHNADWARLRPWVFGAIVCALAVTWSAAGLGDEHVVSLDGDMPRYLMNGVFLADVVRDLPLFSPLTYAQQYYARYPALSLGHHPFLPAIAEIPFFLVTGISVLSARLSVLAALLVGIICWFRLLRAMYDDETAAFGSLLLITTPGFTALYRVVLSEPYTIALILTSLYAMHRYGETQRRGWAVAFCVSVVMSAYAKHLAVALFPVYALQLANALGVRRLIARPTLIAAGIIGVCLLPLVALTLTYSQYNLMLVARVGERNQRATSNNLLRFIRRLIGGPFAVSTPLLAMAGVAAAAALLRRDMRGIRFMAWILGIYSMLLIIGVRNDRFVCYWLPPFAGLGASLLPLGRSRAWRVPVATLLAAVVVYQWTQMGDPSSPSRGIVRLSGAAGYEEAATVVTRERYGDTLLYSAAVDTGYFPFFVRKHDPNRSMVILRADKILTTSRMQRLAFEHVISSPDEVLPTLRKYGVGYVVIEKGRYPEGPLRWLETAVGSDDFELRRVIPLVSVDRRLRDASLSIYRFKGMQPASPDAALSISIPLMNDRINVRLSDLLDNE